ncbi:MAG: transglutaminase-like domain-containing protein [Cytophagaceae bacterium]
MQASAKRKLRSGQEYNPLFPASRKTEKTVIRNASVFDTVNLVQSMVADTLEDTRQLAEYLQGNSLEETCRNIWEFIYKHIQYKQDKKGVEQVRRPSRTWADRKDGVDCDCYTVFKSSILTNLGIPHKLRMTKYYYRKNFQHIYVIVPKDGNVHQELDIKSNRDKYIVLDCVTNAYNFEHPYTEKKDFNMELNRLDGLGNIGHAPVGELGFFGIFKKKPAIAPATPRTEAPSKATQQNVVRAAARHNQCTCQGLGNVGDPIISHVMWTADGKAYAIADDKSVYEIIDDGMDGLGKISLKSIGNAVANVTQVATKIAVVPITAPIQATQTLIKTGSIKEAISAPTKSILADIKKVANTAEFKFLNRFFNPAALLIRNGILILMKLNGFQVASRLRFAYWSKEKALAEGWNEGEWNKLRGILTKLEEIYEQSGGIKTNLRKAILGGKGNKNKAVDPNNPSGVMINIDSPEEKTFNDPEEARLTYVEDPLSNEQLSAQVQVNGLGYCYGLGELSSTATAASITAATGAVTAIALMINSIKAPKNAVQPTPPVKTGNEQTDKLNEQMYQAQLAAYNTGQATIALEETNKLFNPETKQVAQRLATEAPSSVVNTLVAQTETTSTTQTTTETKKEDDKKFNWKPWAIGGGILAALGVGYAVMKKDDKKNPADKPVSGPPRKRKSSKKKAGKGKKLKVVSL